MQRLQMRQGAFAPKTYIYTVGVSPRGHILHWLYISHLHGLFTQAARQLQVDLEWKQSNKHKNTIPDATIGFQGKTYKLEVDNSTEGMRLDRVAGKVDADTLIVAFKSEERFRNLSTLGGLATWHGYFHDQEESGFNILSAPVWWNGNEWIALL